MHEIDEWPEATIKRYQDYAQRHFLPIQAQQMYLAQIPYIVAASAGTLGKNMGFNDFVLTANPKAVVEAKAAPDEETHPLLLLKKQREMEAKEAKGT